VAKSDKPRILMDASALIALIKGEPGAERLDGLLGMIDRNEAVLVESVLVLGEVYKHSDADDEGERRRHDYKLASIRRLLESRAVVLLDVTPPIVKKATEYRLNKAPRKLPDAIHLATAVLNRCDWLVTFDDDFPEEKGIRTFRWSHLRDPNSKLPWAVAAQDPLFRPSNVELLSSTDQYTG